MDPSIRTWVEVSRSALVHNARELKRSGNGVRLMAIVKSNAYGHGIKEVVRSVDAEVDWFGVDSLPEAETVRGAGSKKPVLILGYTPKQALARVVRQGFSQVVYDRETVAVLSGHASPRRPAKVHVKIETGTSRQGICPEDLASFIRFIAKQPNVRFEGMSTHYANIEDTNDPTHAMRQLKRFREAVKIASEAGGKKPELLHTACSAAILTYPETHFDIVRAGISLYGLWSSGVTRRAVLDAGKSVRLEPALTWKSVIAQVKKIRKGTPVSYGLTERVTRDAVVAVVPVGYWDGFDRGLSSVGNVLVRGKRAKVLGRICMNMCVVDVTDIRGVKAEDEVVLLGRQGKERISAEELADKLGTINYEVLTRINPTLPRSLTD